MSKENNRYIDPLTGFGFKYLFGTETNREILIELLNVLFEGERRILNAVSVPEKDLHNQNTGVLLDLVCTDENGKTFTVEIQHFKENEFRKKNQIFISRHFENASAKDQQNSKAVYNENYLIGFLDFPLNERIRRHHFKDVNAMQNASRENFSGALGFKFLEMPFFNEPEEDLEDELDKWLYLFRNMQYLDERPDALDSPVFERIFKRAEIANLTTQERMEYNESLMAGLGYRHQDQAAEQTAEEQKKTKRKTKAREWDPEKDIDPFPFGITVKMRLLTPEEVERFKLKGEKPN